MTSVLRSNTCPPDEADAWVHALARDWHGAALHAADAALCAFAEAVTRHPASMNETHIAALRTAGFDDRAIHDATQIISYFNYINRIADTLGVEPETFVRRWGEEDTPPEQTGG